MNDFLSIIPGVARLLYVNQLFAWLEDSLAGSSQSTVAGYAKVSDSLIDALSTLAKEVGSISLLRYVDQLREANKILGPENASSDSKALRHGLEKLPALKQQKRIVYRLVCARIIKWIIIGAIAATALSAIKAWQIYST
ncbi:MAG: hypothetical protein DLM73_16300 [Chthoniobacterales bacterium]|nr:MAG: hypothetical protein DLM73_16300 [Chthoniobacterales bacterium]